MTEPFDPLDPPVIGFAVAVFLMLAALAFAMATPADKGCCVGDCRCMDDDEVEQFVGPEHKEAPEDYPRGPPRRRE